MGLSTTQITPLGLISPSYFKYSRSCPRFASHGAMSRPFSNALHRFCGERPSVTVDSIRIGERRKLASRNYTTVFSAGVDTSVYNSTKSAWSQNTKSLRETKMLQKSRSAQHCKMEYTEVKNEHTEVLSSYSAIPDTIVVDKNYMPRHDKSCSEKQVFPGNGRNPFVDSKAHPSSVIFSSDVEGGCGENMALDNVNGQEIHKKSPKPFYSKSISGESKGTEFNTGGSGNIAQGQMNGQATYTRSPDISYLKTMSRERVQTEMKTDGRGFMARGNVNGQALYDKRPNNSSAKHLSRESARINGSMMLKSNVAPDVVNHEAIEALSVKILEHSQERNSSEIEHATTDRIESRSNQTKENCTLDSDAESSFNSKETSRRPDIKKKLTSIYNKVLVVNNVSMAEEVVRKLTHEYRHMVHACDTEVAKIEVKGETPVDHGEIICFSIYSGPEADFGKGKSCIWVDVLDGGGFVLLDKFAPFFKDPSIKKVWHNYSFDNHVIENYDIPVSGFYADTMHMARLWNSSRRVDGGYSLEALTSDRRVMDGVKSNYEELIGKMSMKTIFGKNKVKKDGSEGKMITIAPVEELQREERESWICYSALDAISTWQLYESLKRKLFRMPWNLDGKPAGNMFDFYKKYWQPFGEILVRMERDGILVNRAYLAEIEKVAKAEQEVAANRFRNWASKYCPDAKHMNIGSDTQLRQLLFGGTANRKNPEDSLEYSKTFKIPNVDKVIEEGKKSPTKFRNITLHKIGDFRAEIFTATGRPSVSVDALKSLAGKVSAEYDFTDDAVMDDCELEASEDSEIKVSFDLKGVDTSAYGLALKAFSSPGEGMEACHAIASLCEVCAIDSLISNFILPLQGDNVSGKDKRVHCSLNINTETGRLSARRPNLQNQPALEKDRYKIRQAFIAAPGNSLIVADYGQLELRILAHLADCKSMLEAFKAGGDFHSRTAMNMYPYIREAVDKGEVLLEWYPQPGEDKPPAPLLKDAFGSERRKAKMLNFSIAYGKTPVGLSRDWKVSLEEAEATVDLWYKERQEVLEWQEDRKQEAKQHGRVHTLLGRARVFPSMTQATRAQRGHIERAAINTPVQGSAADVAMCAMLQISKNKRLKELKWKLLLQIHDEVILEGPAESAEEAKAIVVECMSKPFNGVNNLKVDLSVDAKCAQNWYDAK